MFHSGSSCATRVRGGYARAILVHPVPPGLGMVLDVPFWVILCHPGWMDAILAHSVPRSNLCHFVPRPVDSVAECEGRDRKRAPMFRFVSFWTTVWLGPAANDGIVARDWSGLMQGDARQ